MGFDRVFFRNIGDLIEDYYKVYPCGAVSLTIRAGNEEYIVAKILKCDEALLTFSYYDAEKSFPLLSEAKEKSGESKALPALTLPYGAIFWVEFNPGKAASEHEIGFTAPAKA